MRIVKHRTTVRAALAVAAGLALGALTLAAGSAVSAAPESATPVGATNMVQTSAMSQSQREVDGNFPWG